MHTPRLSVVGQLSRKDSAAVRRCRHPVTPFGDGTSGSDRERGQRGDGEAGGGASPIENTTRP
jgi:hypothetical protein